MSKGPGRYISGMSMQMLNNRSRRARLLRTGSHGGIDNDCKCLIDSFRRCGNNSGTTAHSRRYAPTYTSSPSPPIDIGEEKRPVIPCLSTCANVFFCIAETELHVENWIASVTMRNPRDRQIKAPRRSGNDDDGARRSRRFALWAIFKVKGISERGSDAREGRAGMCKR